MDDSELEFQNAVFSGGLFRLRSLLGQGVDVNVRCKNSTTQLHWAVQAGHSEVVLF